MNDLAARFDEFFRALWGYEPFPWQRRLAARLVTPDGRWPDACALPTAAGKTACIDAAVFALACQADLPAEKRTAPRRIFFVVDRRVIVDEAFERASKMADQLASARAGILKDVADRLRNVAGGGSDVPPLTVHALRGGLYRDDAWARTPSQPAIVCSTVDQVGSRLLFRGYGHSSRAWPLLAGLVGNDSLILLDEAHCSVPFLQTLQSVARYRNWGTAVPASPFSVVVLSATPPCRLTDVLRTEDEDIAHPVLGRRLRASKPTRLVEARKAKGEHAIELLAEELARQAKDLLTDGRLAIAVIANRVATARMVHERLTQLAGEGGSRLFDCALLVGRMRPLDRDETVARWLTALNASKSGERRLERPVVICATQCLEVGANLDFDGMVSECAALDALRQRFGRLNRMGREIDARGVIVIRADQVKVREKPSEQDPIYGNALPETWRWLNEKAVGAKMDMGFQTLSVQLAELDAAAQACLCAMAPDAPAMLPAYVDAWAQTAPEPCPSPEPALFLHGPEHGAPEIQVCWRADLDPVCFDEDAWIAAVSLRPPAVPECMPVQLHVLRRWMTGSANGVGLAHDLQSVHQGADPEEAGTTGLSKRVLCWRGPDDSLIVADPRHIRPGDTIVIPASLGGWEVFGHLPAGSAPDRADRAGLDARRQALLCLHSGLWANWPLCPARDRLRELLDPVGDPDAGEVLECIHDLAESSQAPADLKRLAEALKGDRRARLIEHPLGGWLVRGSRHPGPCEGETVTTEDDSASHGQNPVLLTEHLDGVRGRARTYAAQCLPIELTADLELAAFLHDMGKADPRFQAWLHGGNCFFMGMPAGEMLAKSEGLPQDARTRAKARERSGLPKGFRHEMLSMQLAVGSGRLERATDPDLVLHLIASHHGYGRPFAPVAPDAEPPTVSFEAEGVSCALDAEARKATPPHRLDSGVAERFWRLTRRYGWWGLAYLEAILRLADHRQSEAEQVEERVAQEAAS